MHFFARSLSAPAFGLLLMTSLCTGCGSGGMQRDARTYARMEKEVNAIVAKASALHAKGDNKAHFAELEKIKPLGDKMLAIRGKYKSDSKDGEFMDAVEEAKAALK